VRLLLAAQPEQVTTALDVVQRVLERHLRESAGLVGGKGQDGAETLIQRFGSAANLNVHLQCLVLDGVYRSDAEGVPEIIEAAAPTDEALHAFLHTVIARPMKMLTRRGGGHVPHRLRITRRPKSSSRMRWGRGTSPCDGGQVRRD
jgi:hypothetical protein